MADLKSFIHDATLGAIAATALDAFVEVSRFPVVNEPVPSTFQLPGVDRWSVAEALIYYPASAAFILGALDLFGGGKLVPGVGRELMGYGAGAILGANFYESNIARWIGIRDTT